MIQFFINQYKAVNLVVILVITIGTLTFIQGRKEGFPNIGFDIITISVAYRGASADDVEALVTKKIEDEIETVEGANKITSFSSEGRAVISFEIDNAIGRANSEIMDELESAVDKLSFPDGVSDPIIRELAFSTVNPNLRVGFLGNIDTEELKRITRRFKEDVKSVPGVGKVTLHNYPKLEIWVDVIPEKLQAYDTELNTIIAALNARNINVPAGKITVKNKEFFIKTSKEYSSLAEIENTIIRVNDKGFRVLLKDLANVRWAHEELTTFLRSGGNQGIWLNVFKTPNGDTIKVSKGVKTLLAEYEAKGYLPAGGRTATVDDLAFYVERRLSVLSTNATVGLLLVFLCMIVFFNLRVTLWTMLGIPFSFCLAIIIAYAIGLTLNLMTMFGLIIVVGMIVDDAIIIAESIYTRVERGMPFRQAALEGTQEMLIPVIAIIATTTLAFLPLATLPGIFGDVLGIIPKIVIITLLCSLVECVFVLPGHLAHLRDNAAPLPQADDELAITADSSAVTTASTSKQTKKTPRDQRRWFRVVSNAYEKVLMKWLRKPILTTTLFLGTLFGLAFGLGSQVPFVFFPGEAESIIVDIETPTYNNLAATAKVLDKAEASIAANTGDYVVDIVSTVGQDSTFDNVPDFQSYLGYIRVFLDTSRDESDDELTALIEDSIKATPGMVSYSVKPLKGGPPAGKPIDVYVTGKNISTILAAAKEVNVFITKLPNTASVSTGYKDGKQGISVLPDETLASIVNVNLRDIATAVSNAFANESSLSITSLSSFSTNDDEVELIVKYITNETKTLNDINNTPIPNQRGFMIPLESIAKLDYTTNSGRLIKEDGKLYISVSALLKDQNDRQNSATALVAQIKEQIPLWQAAHPAVDFELKGEQEEQQELIIGTIRALLLAIFGIYFVLTVIFKSYVQPLIVMSIIPLGFVGIVIGLFITGTPIGLMPFLGGVALMGIIVNDSLVMVDKINRLQREKKLNVFDAVVTGAKSRIRPILMTSITTVVGIAPLAYGLLGEEPFLAPMAIALMWGLMISTLLLLILLPAFYLLIDRFMKFIYRLFKREYSIGNSVHHKTF